MGNLKLRLQFSAVAGLAAAALLGGAPMASAEEASTDGTIGVQNWESYINNAAVGFQSRAWKDEQYSQVWFHNCDIVSGAGIGNSAHVDLRWRRSLQPDRSWGVKRYTQCFSSKSSGQWHNLSSGNHFFQITKLGDQVTNPYARLAVGRVVVDTSKADQN